MVLLEAVKVLGAVEEAGIPYILPYLLLVILAGLEVLPRPWAFRNWLCKSWKVRVNASITIVSNGHDSIAMA